LNPVEVQADNLKTDSTVVYRDPPKSADIEKPFGGFKDKENSGGIVPSHTE
jgi:hypothetical protein